MNEGDVKILAIVGMSGSGLSVFISCFISLIILNEINLEIEVYVIKLALVAVIAFISCFIILYLLNLFIKYERVK